MNKRLAAAAAITAAVLATGAGAILLLQAPIRARQTAAAAVSPVATPLVTGKAITPQGTQTEVGSFPVHMILSPDGRFAVVTNSGAREYVSVLRVSDGGLVSRIGFNAPRTDGAKRTNGTPYLEGLYYGLAWGNAEGGKTTLYVSRGSEQKVGVLTLTGDGKLEDTGRTLANPSGLPQTLLPNHVAGIAVSRDGSRVYAANNMANPLKGMNGSLSILSAAGAGAAAVTISLPGYPFAVAALTTGPDADKKVYVTSEQAGTVHVIDPAAARTLKAIPTGAQPMGLLLNRAQDRLYVANAGSDTISVLRTDTDTEIQTILLRPDDARGLPGATPTGLALSPDEKRLYVTLADMNAVAVVGVSQSKVVGYIPVGWYPTAVVVSPDNRSLLVANAKGVAARNPNDKPKPGLTDRPQYIQNILEGTVSLVTLPGGEADLKRLTEQTLANNLTHLVARPHAFRNPGIEHVIYIIKENRTYDQVLGDLPQGNGDPSLVLFGREVTPNQHALAERFVLLDNFYCCAEVSGDGWNWSTSGMANEYAARNVTHNYAGRVRNYDFEGQNNALPVDLAGIPDVSRSPGGYLWDLAARHNVSFRNYGFFMTFPVPKEIPIPPGLTLPPPNIAGKRVLARSTNEDFRMYDLDYADSEAWVRHALPPAPKQRTEYGSAKDPARITTWRRDFERMVREKQVPRLMMVRLGRDHTSGTAAGKSSPRAMVADNDYAVGQLVEAVSRSPIWKKCAIFIVEDDAQNGYDHVDAHRSIAFVISPFVRKATLDSRFYNTDSVLRTMELLLGLPPMTQYDAVAPPFAVFTAKADNDAPHAAILPARAIVGEVNQTTAYRAQDSARLINPLIEESAPDEELNDILWHAIKGRHVPAPARRYTLRARPVQEED